VAQEPELDGSAFQVVDQPAAHAVYGLTHGLGHGFEQFQPLGSLRGPVRLAGARRRGLSQLLFQSSQVACLGGLQYPARPTGNLAWRRVHFAPPVGLIDRCGPFARESEARKA
jgi:hypothetical protein